MTDDLVKRLRTRAAALRGIGGIGHDDAKTDEEAADHIEELEQQITGLASVVGELIDEDAAERIEALEAEVQRLKDKCDLQATILQHLSPDRYHNVPFIHDTLGEKDSNGMPQKLMVIPALGVEFSYIYEYTGKTTGPEW